MASEKLAVATATLASTANVATIPLPATLMEILTIRSLPGTTGEAVIVWFPVTRQELADLSSMSSAPEQYAYVFEPPSSIRLPWAPSVSDPTFATIEFVRTPTLLTAPGDIPTDIPLAYHDLLAELVVHRIALSEEDQPLAQSAWNIAQSLRTDLREHTGRKGGRARPYIAVRGLSW